MGATTRRKREDLAEEGRLREIFLAQIKGRLSERRKSLNWLADFSGVNRGYMSELLRGQKTPTLNILARLAMALECEPWELLKPDKQS